MIWIVIEVSGVSDILIVPLVHFILFDILFGSLLPSLGLFLILILNVEKLAIEQRPGKELS